MTTTKYGYAESRDAEVWHEAEGDTREAAAAFALKETGGEVVYVGEQRLVDKLSILVPHAVSVIDMADDNVAEIAPWWEDSLFDNTLAARNRLQHFLWLACWNWLKEYPGPAVWQVSGKITEHRPADTLAATK